MIKNPRTRGRFAAARPRGVGTTQDQPIAEGLGWSPGHSFEE